MLKYKQVVSARALLLNLEARLNFTMASYKPVTHVIFDLDGLILDTETINKQRYTELLGRYGKEFTLECRMRCLGARDPDCARALIELAKLPMTMEEFLVQSRALHARDMEHIPLMPGSERLIRHLSGAKIPLAIATSSCSNTYTIKAKDYKELFSLFHHVVTAGDDPEVKNGKPAPDTFLVAAKRFDNPPTPDKCLVLEDAPFGVQGSKAAGMQVVMVPDSVIPEEKRKDATLVLKSLEEFRPELFGLPPFTEKK